MSPRTRTSDEQRPMLAAITEQALQADENGFDAVFLTEHHLSTHNPFQNSLQFGSYLAPQLKQAYVGLSVANIAVHQPVRFVESCNLLDQLTNGRTIIGVGTGLVPSEFLAFGRDPQSRSSLFEETLEVVLRIWNVQPGDQPYEFATSAERGRVDQPVVPQPFRKPHPILAHATARPETLVRAANRGWPVLFANLQASATRTTVQVYWDALASAHHQPETVALCQRWTGFLKRIYVAETDAAAQRDIRGPIERLIAEVANEDGAAAQPVENRFGVSRSPEAIMRNNVICGSPDTVTAQIREYADAGVGQMMAMFLWDMQYLEQSARSFRLFIDEVMPRFVTPSSSHAGRPSDPHNEARVAGVRNTLAQEVRFE